MQIVSMLRQNDDLLLLQLSIPWEFNNETIRNRHKSLYRLILKNEIEKAKHVKPIHEKL